MIPRLRSVGSSALESLASSETFDGLVVLFHSTLESLQLPASLSLLNGAIQEHAKLDASVSKTPGALIVTPFAPGKRLILSPLGSLTGDTDDVRRFAEAARKALAKCATVGIKRPLLLMPSNLPLNNPRFSRDYALRTQVTLLGLLAEAYVPLQTREHTKQSASVFEEIGFVTDEKSGNESAVVVDAIEQGRFLARGRHIPISCTPNANADQKRRRWLGP